MKWFILMAMAVSVSEGSRGVICEADAAPPSPITDLQQELAFDCALGCLAAGESSCTGFAMSWGKPECVAQGAGSPPKSDYTCRVS